MHRDYTDIAEFCPDYEELLVHLVFCFNTPNGCIQKDMGYMTRAAADRVTLELDELTNGTLRVADELHDGISIMQFGSDADKPTIREHMALLAGSPKTALGIKVS